MGGSGRGRTRPSPLRAPRLPRPRSSVVTRPGRPLTRRSVPGPVVGLARTGEDVVPVVPVPVVALVVAVAAVGAAPGEPPELAPRVTLVSGTRGGGG